MRPYGELTKKVYPKGLWTRRRRPSSKIDIIYIPIKNRKRGRKVREFDTTQDDS